MGPNSKHIDLEKADYSTIHLALNHSKKKILKYMSDSSSTKTLSELHRDKQKIEKLEEELRKIAFTTAYEKRTRMTAHFFSLYRNTIMGCLGTFRQDCMDELNQAVKSYAANSKERTKRKELQEGITTTDAVLEKIRPVQDESSD